jgi:hypothetical protein
MAYIYYIPELDLIFESEFSDIECFYLLKDVTKLYDTVKLGEL